MLVADDLQVGSHRHLPHRAEDGFHGRHIVDRDDAPAVPAVDERLGVGVGQNTPPAVAGVVGCLPDQAADPRAPREDAGRHQARVGATGRGALGAMAQSLGMAGMVTPSPIPVSQLSSDTLNTRGEQ